MLGSYTASSAGYGISKERWTVVPVPELMMKINTCTEEVSLVKSEALSELAGHVFYSLCLSVLMLILLCTSDSALTDSRGPQQCLPFQCCLWANWSTRSLLSLGTASPKTRIRRHLPVLPGAAFIRLKCHLSLSIHGCMSAYHTQSEPIEEHKGHRFLWNERFLKTLTCLSPDYLQPLASVLSQTLLQFLKLFIRTSTSCPTDIPGQQSSAVSR